MSATKKQANERLKVKKMSKAQMQQAIIKKRQCDAKAFAIVEQLLEPTVNPDWLLQNLEFISKSHMEDVIEERSIVKLCGYVLCSKSLTVIVQQQYHISTRNNKVYDISKRKKFCSSSCYGAANFLLEQMLESPLWLREKNDILVFQILPVNSNQHMLGDEIDVAGITLTQNIDAVGCVEKSKIDNSETKCSKELKVKQTRKDKLFDVSNLKRDSVHGSNLLNVETNATNDISLINIDCQALFNSKPSLSKLQINKKNKDCKSIKPINCESNYDNKIQNLNIKVDNLDVEITEYSKNMSCEDNIRNTEDKNTSANIMCKSDNCNTDKTQLNEISGIQTKLNTNGSNEQEKVQCHLNESNKNSRSITRTQLNENSSQNGYSDKLQFYSDQLYDNRNHDNKQLESQSDKTTENNHENEKIIQSYSTEECTSNVLTSKSSYLKGKQYNNKSSRNTRCRQKEFNNVETDANICYIVMHIEKSVREWVTENTLCLLLGEEDEKCKILESLVQHDRYQQLCKKLNRLQLEDKQEDRVLEKNILKPLPHFSVLQEEGKNMELKVRAFYEGRTTLSEDSNNESENKNDEDNELILPLTASHTPIAIRRRLFLDKLSKILPDLFRALTSNTNYSAEFTYNNEKYSLVKILISTFNLSAANIVFKTAEWTLVGLIIIKMLSLIDTQMKSLLETKQASLYTSMILMSYKLDSIYLDRLLMEITMDVNKLYNKCKRN